MPAYLQGNVTCLTPGDQKYLWGVNFASATGPVPGQIQAPNDANVDTEVVTEGQKSVAVQLTPMPGRVPGCMVQVIVGEDPGAAVIEIQESAIDEDALYLVPTNAAYTLNAWTLLSDGTYMAYSQLQPDSGGFLRLKAKTLPNSPDGIKAKIIYI